MFSSDAPVMDGALGRSSMFRGKTHANPQSSEDFTTETQRHGEIKIQGDLARAEDFTGKPDPNGPTTLPLGESSRPSHVFFRPLRSFLCALRAANAGILPVLRGFSGGKRAKENERKDAKAAKESGKVRLAGAVSAADNSEFFSSL